DRLKRLNPWAFLPPLFSICVAAGLFIVCQVVLYNLFCDYFSIAGNSPPASCVFSQIMNMGAFAGLFIAVFRYLQLKNTLYNPWLNTICLLAFSSACFGMTLIGNFQLFVEEQIHNFGTFLTFGLGTLFCWIQSYITLKVNFKNEGFRTSILRFLLSGGITICFILYSTLMAQDFHMHAARGQWSLVMLFLIFIGTFYVEFRHSRMGYRVTDISAEPVSMTFTEMSTHSDT
uniref:CWH43-like N-terminal domain-containing protein n=1 Tax=Periophthalmus magnuspinnatus TaxID=409849 RepID=A0A3B4ANG1_9GOBI